MANIIKIKRTKTAGKTPTTTQLQEGELALNLTDKKLFTSDGAKIIELGGTKYAQDSVIPKGTIADQAISPKSIQSLVLNKYESPGRYTSNMIVGLQRDGKIDPLFVDKSFLGNYYIQSQPAPKAIAGNYVKNTKLAMRVQHSWIGLTSSGPLRNSVQANHFLMYDGSKWVDVGTSPPPDLSSAQKFADLPKLLAGTIKDEATAPDILTQWPIDDVPTKPAFKGEIRIENYQPNTPAGSFSFDFIFPQGSSKLTEDYEVCFAVKAPAGSLINQPKDTFMGSNLFIRSDPVAKQTDPIIMATEWQPLSAASFNSRMFAAGSTMGHLKDPVNPLGTMGGPGFYNFWDSIDIDPGQRPTVTSITGGKHYEISYGSSDAPFDVFLLYKKPAAGVNPMPGRDVAAALGRPIKLNSAGYINSSLIEIDGGTYS